MTDEVFVERFERAELESFAHADHVRLACAYLDTCDEPEALRRLERGLLALATRKGVPGKFHRTLTRAWFELVAHARRRHDARRGDALLAACPALADAAFIHRFYSPELLASDAARADWIGPDRQPLDATVY
ncbi:MAG TPA: hypothetical protein VD833_26535 [Vicinamibacterales bacterium]|nr:hypothetical protein [Vicinamibacterales bacterium]